MCTRFRKPLLYPLSYGGGCLNHAGLRDLGSRVHCNALHERNAGGCSDGVGDPATVRLSVAHASSAQFLLAFLFAAAAGTAVFFHAERNKIPHPSAWASFVFLLLVVGLPSYWLHVRRVRRGRSRT